MDKLLPPAGTMMLPTEEHAEPSFHRIKINLVHLSPELLVDIVTMLPRSDLKSLRLMNRVLCGIASSKMFESITVRDDPRSLEQLKQIASSQTWASQVRHIDWLLCTVAGDSKNSWWPDPVFLLSRLMKPHLTVQCEYLQLLPSIKTVHFTGHVSELTTLLPEPASDLYVLVTRAKLQPSVVQAGNLSLEIGYGSSGYIRELSISGVAPQIEDASEAQGPFFAPTLRPWPEGGATLSPLVFRTIACQVNQFTPTRCTLKIILLHLHHF